MNNIITYDVYTTLYSINEGLDFDTIKSKLDTVLSKLNKENCLKLYKIVVDFIDKFNNQSFKSKLFKYILPIFLGLTTLEQISQLTPDNFKSEIEFKDTREKFRGGIKHYLDKLAFTESTDRWYITNSIGYIGKYQFGDLSIKDLKKLHPEKYHKIDINKFRNISKKDIPLKLKKKLLTKIFPQHLQDEAIKDLIILNKKYLGDYKQYLGKKIDGIKITESGLIASAHLVGYRKIKEYLHDVFDNNKTNVDIPKDGNDVEFTVYLNKFGNYNLKKIL